MCIIHFLGKVKQKEKFKAVLGNFDNTLKIKKYKRVAYIYLFGRILAHYV